MLVRLIGDNMKAFLRGQGIIKELGMFINIQFCFFIVYSYVIMEIFQWGIFGYGLSLFVYECTSLSSGLYFFFFKIDPRIRNTEISVFKNLGWFFNEGAKATLPLMVTWVVDELSIIILTLLHSNAQLAAFAFLLTVPNTVFKLCQGF